MLPVSHTDSLVIPGGLATGPRQMHIAYRLEPVMRFFLWIMYPIAGPLAKLLDYLTYEEDYEEGYNRGELSALVRIQQEQDLAKRLPHAVRTKALVTPSRPVTAPRPVYKTTPYNYRTHRWSELKKELLERTRDLYDDDWDALSFEDEQTVPALTNVEVEIVESALQMKTKLVLDVYTPLTKLYSISETMVLNKHNMSQLYGKRYSRVPVYRPNPDDESDETAVLGFLLVRYVKD